MLSDQKGFCFVTHTLVLEKSEFGEGRRKQRGPEGQDPLLNFLNKGGVVKYLVRNLLNFNDDSIGEAQLPCLPPPFLG